MLSRELELHEVGSAVDGDRSVDLPPADDIWASVRDFKVIGELIEPVLKGISGGGGPTASRVR